ncbi:dioxygenase [Hoeflea prorocentri]|uniref:Hydroxyquinol 1,2-dioxygenase n=1 Tax=Hoeflea prorocentri TaxID=1922333 RepID=A0A9X3UK03_9HYPH|nr:dioxygenase [Hoeflea prorocentri]MCY6381986.1 hydroxyquinol 1,2-dioxygenase [Hoeflea prorocentri]MDA5399786.1 hydroxyquinol 1,2-dioxygenase [Hoeflea prorocentri]
MRNVTSDNLTQAFLDYCGPDTSPRLRFILEHLVRHLHDFVKETGLTHDEWRKGIELLTSAGEMTDSERNEFVLMSDVLGLSSLVDMINSKPEATSSSVLGPFHILGAPELAFGGDLKGDNEGATVIVQGTVSDANGKPIAGAGIELWQTADNGLYSNQDPAQGEYNLRAHLTTKNDGQYALTTVRPAPYTVPDDGPVGELLHATGRHPWRPSHLHFIVSAPGFQTLVTEVFPSDDPYLDEDAVFGVRSDLIMDYVEETDTSLVPDLFEAKDRLTVPFYKVDFDFKLARESA